MTTPNILQPPKSFRGLSPRELMSAEQVDDNGDPLPPLTLPGLAMESITLHTHGNQPLELTEQPAEDVPYLGYHEEKYDASWATHVRGLVNVAVVGASDAQGVVQWSPTAADDDWRSAGETGDVRVRINALGTRVGAGVLASAAKAAADVYWRMVFRGGDGSLSPRIGRVGLQFYRAPITEVGTETLYLRDPEPDASPTAAIADGGWVSIYGCNTPARPLSELVLAPDGLSTVYAYSSFGSQAAMESDGWVFGSFGGGLGGWAFTAPGGIPSIGNTGVVIKSCCGKSQNAVVTASLPASAKGYRVFMGFRTKLGVATVVGFPGQCPVGCPPLGGLQCDVLGAGVIASVGATEYKGGAAVAWYRSSWGSYLDSEVYTTIPGPFAGGDVGVAIFHGQFGVSTLWSGYGACAWSASAVAVVEVGDKLLTLSTTKGASTKTVRSVTPYDAKRASGGVWRAVGDPLAAQDIPEATWRFRGAAKVTRGARYCAGVAHVKVWVWRPSNDSEVGILCEGTTAILDGTMREFTVEMTGAALSVAAGDRLVIDGSASLDAQCGTGSNDWPPSLRTEGAGVELEYDGTDTSFADGSTSDGAATQLTGPALTYA